MVELLQGILRCTTEELHGLDLHYIGYITISDITSSIMYWVSSKTREKYFLMMKDMEILVSISGLRLCNNNDVTAKQALEQEVVGSFQSLYYCTYGGIELQSL